MYKRSLCKMQEGSILNKTICNYLIYKQMIKVQLINIRQLDKCRKHYKYKLTLESSDFCPSLVKMNLKSM